MKRILTFFNTIIDEYGVKAFSALLLFAVMVFLVLFAFFFSYTSGGALPPRVSIGELLQSAPAFARHLLPWLLRALPAAALFALCRQLGKRLLLGGDDPLFAPRATFLLLPVLLLVLWEVPFTHAIFGEIVRDTSGISQLITLIMLIGLATNLLQFVSLRSEHHAFVQTERELPVVHPEMEEWLARVDQAMNRRRSILAEKWRSLRDVFDYSLHVDYETLMAFPNQREFLKESKVSFIIKILPLLGLIGTVLGFTLAVTGMQDAAVNMQDFSSFKGNMLEALGGMKTAFLTTLIGMVGMVVVMWLSSLLEESRRRILLMEDEFLYINFFLPWQQHQRQKHQAPP